MSARKATVLLLVLLSTLAVAQKKPKKPSLPAVFKDATYVYVEAVEGQQSNWNLYADDRQAIADVQDALRDWSRYTLTMRRDEADLVIVVRKGRIGDAKRSVGIGTTPMEGPTLGPPRSSGPITSDGEADLPADLFEVCQFDANGKLSNPLWTRTLANGLNEPKLTLFRQFRDAVDRAYPSQPATPPAAPPSKP
jgi:hypothetical protein